MLCSAMGPAARTGPLPSGKPSRLLMTAHTPKLRFGVIMMHQVVLVSPAREPAVSLSLALSPSLSLSLSLTLSLSNVKS